MKKIVFFLLLLPSCVYGQDGFTVSGIVTDCKYKVVISSVTVKLVGSDGSNIETKTDSKGHYLFDSTQVHLNTQYVVTTQAGIDVKTTNAPRGYLNSSDKMKLKITSSSDKNTKVDFCLVPARGCTYGPPLIYFKKNTVDFESGTDIHDTISFIYQLLADNPTLVIEIAGNASKDEKNPQELGQKRADLIRELLIKKGIESERMISKSYSNTKPHIGYDEDTSEEMIYDKEYEFEYKLNRRVVISAIRRDYIPQNPKKEQPTNNLEENEGE